MVIRESPTDFNFQSSLIEEHVVSSMNEEWSAAGKLILENAFIQCPYPDA